MVGFCQARKIPTEGIRLIQVTRNNAETGALEHVDQKIMVPEDFPEQYRAALANVAASCKVKKALLSPPTVSVETVVVSAENSG